MAFVMGLSWAKTQPAFQCVTHKALLVPQYNVDMVLTGQIEKGNKVSGIRLQEAKPVQLPLT